MLKSNIRDVVLEYTGSSLINWLIYQRINNLIFTQSNTKRKRCDLKSIAGINYKGVIIAHNAMLTVNTIVDNTLNTLIFDSNFIDGKYSQDDDIIIVANVVENDNGESLSNAVKKAKKEGLRVIEVISVVNTLSSILIKETFDFPYKYIFDLDELLVNNA